MSADALLARMTTEQQLLLRCVLGPEEGAPEAFRSWRASVDIDRLDGASDRLLPLLARRFGRLAPDDPVRARVRGVYRHAWVKNQLLTRDAARVAGALRRHDIPVVLLKGAALAKYYGYDHGARPMHDVDLLVPVDRVTRAVEVLRVTGCTPRPPVPNAWISARLVGRRHSMSFSGELEGQIDLHWHVLSRSLGKNADDHFWADAEPFDLAGVEVRALVAADLLLHVLVHGARSTSGGHLQWVADAVHLLRATDGPGLSGRLAREARDHAVLETVHSCLVVLDRICEEPAVGPLLRELASTRPSMPERLTSSRRVPAPARRLVREVTRHGGGATPALRQIQAFVRETLELTLVARPMWYSAYVLSGHRAAVASAIRHRSGRLALTSVLGARYELGTELDLRDVDTCARVAGPGWPRLTDSGLRSVGTEARIVLEVDEPIETDLELCIEVSRGEDSDDGPTPPIALRVNEAPVGSIDLTPAGSPREHRLLVPRSAAVRFQPMEIAFVVHRGIGRALRDSRTVLLRSLSLRPAAPEWAAR